MDKRRILIVDDNAVIRETLKGLITHDDQFVVVGEAANAETAVTAIRRRVPDLVCLDVEMPGVDGLSLLKRIRKEHETTKVVMITGAATTGNVKKAVALGAHGFVVKPFTASKVLDAIRRALA